MSAETSEGTNDCRAGGNSETNDSEVETNFETLNDCEVIYALPPPLPEPNFCSKLQIFYHIIFSFSKARNYQECSLKICFGIS